MTPETLATLQDFRGRISRAKALEDANEPVPEGLIPTDDEIRQALLALRANRGAATPKPRKSASKITQDFDLNKLF